MVLKRGTLHFHTLHPDKPLPLGIHPTAMFPAPVKKRHGAINARRGNDDRLQPDCPVHPPPLVLVTQLHGTRDEQNPSRPGHLHPQRTAVNGEPTNAILHVREAPSRLD